MLNYEESTHTYSKDGRVIPSVTQISSRIAVRESNDGDWKSISGSEFIVDQKKTSTFGTEFHKVPPILLSGREASYDKKLEPWVKCFWDFLTDYNLMCLVGQMAGQKYFITELPLYSKLGYAGTPDWFYSDGKVSRLIDWKTSTKINLKTTRMQTAAYTNLIKEYLSLRSNAKIERWTVRLDPDYPKGYEVDKRLNESEDWSMFLSCLNVYKNFI